MSQDQEEVEERDWRLPLDDKDIRLPPAKYMSIQRIINSNHGKIDIQKFNDLIDQMTDDGWVELSDISQANKVLDKSISRIRYVTNKNVYRSGGWFVELKDEGDGEYIVYKGFNNAAWTVQLKDIKNLYILPKFARKRKNKNKDQRAIYKKPKNPTNFPVYLQDNDGEYHVVYYARDEYAKDKFTDTKKFKRALKYGWKFDTDHDIKVNLLNRRSSSQKKILAN